MTATGNVHGASTNVQNAQSLLVLKQALNAQKVEGQAAIELIQTAGQVQQGAHEQGSGHTIDTRA